MTDRSNDIETRRYPIDFNFDNSYAENLKGFYAPFNGEVAPKPQLIKFNQTLADTLDLDFSNLSEQEIASVLSGGAVLKGASPLAQVYAGHQFGGFSARLGDGRALLLGEVIDTSGARHDIHLKGSGRTPYSRGGDGKAALGPVLREYILGEAMHALGIPTTRALAAIITGEDVYREKLLPGAVLARTASSHIRVGTFQYFAAQGDYDKVKQLADYTINRHFPSLKNSKKPYLELLHCVCDKQAILLAKWMQVGFVHGVMNTDNMTISGETIDYGPCAFIDVYDPKAVFSSIDHQGRYAYENQMPMAQWNLARLAETLLPLIDEDADESVKLATVAIQEFADKYRQHWIAGMCKKMGLSVVQEGDYELISQLLTIMQVGRCDYTSSFRALSDAIDDGEGVKEFKALFNNASDVDRWMQAWQRRAKEEPLTSKARVDLMNSVNPLYIPRNHIIEAVLKAAESQADYEPFERLMHVLAKPFVKQSDAEDYTKPAPNEFGAYKTFCGT